MAISIALVVTYKPAQYEHISDLQLLLESNGNLKEALEDKPILVYRQPPNLKQHIAKKR